MLGRDGVPRLGRPEVHVVDAVEVHVLRVPRERRLPHAEVQVRRVHALDVDAVVAFHVVEDRAQAVDVPDVLVLVVERARNVGTVYRRAKRDVFPVLPLQFIVVEMTGCFVSKNKI